MITPEEPFATLHGVAEALPDFVTRESRPASVKKRPSAEQGDVLDDSL